MSNKPDVPKPAGPLWPVFDHIPGEDADDAVLTGINIGSPMVASNIATQSYIDNTVGAYGSYGQTNISSPDSDTFEIRGTLVVKDVDGNNEINVSEFMASMQERMCIVQPNIEAMEEYPALKDAYEKYKMLEKLLVKNNAKKD